MKADDAILIVTGSYPPQRCGVGDYSGNLAKSLKASGMNVCVYTTANGSGTFSNEEDVRVYRKAAGWGIFSVLSGFSSLLKVLRSERADCVNIQYPTLGYGYSLGPQLLVFLLAVFSRAEIVPTIHEFRHSGLLRKASVIPFLLFADKLIFTSEKEADAVINYFAPFFTNIKSRLSIIPVGSNIPPSPPGVKRRPGFMVFFGLFYPARQIEFVAEVYKEVLKNNDSAFLGVIGDTHPKYLDYYRDVRRKFDREFPKDKVEWYVGEKPDDIARVLASAAVAILPYPAGASFRRTTLMATMMAGVPVVSTRGVDTPSELRDDFNMLFAEDPISLAEKANLLISDPVLAKKISSNAADLVRVFSWENIASKYISFIRGTDGA
jgi:glycosyltransferase involved in cell wall biosynthesis